MERSTSPTTRPNMEPNNGEVTIDYGMSLVSGRGESHPPALAEPGVKVSPHRAPTGQPSVRTMRCQWAKSVG